MANIATYNDVRATGESQAEVFIVCWVLAFPDYFIWLHPSGDGGHRFQRPSPPLSVSIFVEFGTKQNLPIFVFDFLGQNRSVGDRCCPAYPGMMNAFACAS